MEQKLVEARPVGVLQKHGDAFEDEEVGGVDAAHVHLAGADLLGPGARQMGLA